MLTSHLELKNRRHNIIMSSMQATSKKKKKKKNVYVCAAPGKRREKNLMKISNASEETLKEMQYW